MNTSNQTTQSGEVREHWIDLGPGRRIHCAEQGTGPAVVFLPGNGCSIGDIGPLQQALTKRHRWIGIDVPGREPTAWPDEPFHFVHDLPAVVDRVCDELGVTDHAVIGHSMGAMLALQHARYQAQRGVRRVVGLSLIEGFVSLAVHGLVVCHEGFRPVRMADPTQQAWARRMAANRAWLAAHPIFDQSFTASQQDHDARPWVAELDVPIQVFIGDLGQPMPPKEDLTAWRIHIGMDHVADLEVHRIANAGHWAMLDDPEAVEARVMPFLERVWGGQGVRNANS